MPKMKHLLRKLHIGGGCNNDNHQPSPPQTAEVTPPSSSSSASLESALTRIGAVESAEAENSVDFNFFEEEFQVQLALAISVSDPDAREDPETAQIKAAKQISLGCVPSETLAESLSLRYWSYNFVNYDEKVMDGFYDIYGFNSNSAMREKIPHLLDLQAISVSDNVDFEVILVNRNVDPALHQLEERVYAVSVEHQVLEQDPIISGLIQMIADLVVDRMGGPVRDADELLKRWSLRSHELRSSLNNIILPLGCLDVGLSRHRALLFKVLADKINLPCMLVKGSYYTGTDEGAVNVIKFDNGSEYIIDLMAAPGTLIPAELPSDLQNSGLDISSAVSPDLEQVAKGVGSDSVEASFSGIQSKGNVEHVDEENQTKRFENDFGKLLPLLSRSHERLSGTGGTATDAQKLKVKDVSKYVISAAKNPDFAQKLHAVLVAKQLELPSTDVNAGRSLLSDTTDEGFVLVNCETNEANQTDDVGVVPVRLIETNSGLPVACSAHNERINPALGNVSDWEIPWEGLQIGERIGIGSYGEVYRAEWNGTEVAVKKFMDQDISGDALAQFKYEVEIMLRLRHPNVVLFMGAVTHPPNLSILTEYLPRGSLYKLLHRPNNQLDEKKRMRMAVDVAKGMNYLHTSHPTIVHRDLKTPNLLVDKNWLVKVCDFGLSRVKHHTFLSSNSTAGTGSCHTSVVPSSASLSARHGPSSTNAALLPSLICEAYWQQCANLGFFLAKSVKPTGSSVRLVEPTTPSLAGLARSSSWFDMNGAGHLPLTFRTPPVSPPRPSYLSGMRRVCSLEFRPHLMNSPDTGLADPLLGSGGASGISERSFLPQSTIYNWSCGHFSKPLLTAADDSEEMMARREKNENIALDNIAKCQHSSINKLHNQIASWDTKFETGTKTILLQPFNSVVIAADATERIRIWDYEDAKLLNSFDNHDYPDKGISKLCLVNELDDSLLLVASCDGNVRIWKDYALKGKQKLVTAFSSIQGHRPGVRSVNAIVDWQQQSGYLYASGEVSSIMIWDLDKEQLVNSVPSLSECSISALSASQVHAGQFVAGFVDGSVRLFDIRTPEMLVCTTWPHTQRVERVVGVGFQPGLDLGKIVSASRAGDIQFLDIRRQKDTYLTIDAHRGSLTALAIHRHAPIIASGSTQQRIKVFNLEGEQLGSIRYYTTFMPQKIGSVSCLTFHPYQVLLAAGAADACVSLYADEISPTKMN